MKSNHKLSLTAVGAVLLSTSVWAQTSTNVPPVPAGMSESRISASGTPQPSASGGMSESRISAAARAPAAKPPLAKPVDGQAAGARPASGAKAPVAAMPRAGDGIPASVSAQRAYMQHQNVDGISGMPDSGIEMTEVPMGAPVRSVQEGEASPKVQIKGLPVVETTRAPVAAPTERQEAGMAPPSAISDMRLPSIKSDDAALKPFVLHTRVGVNEVLTLSSNFLNRISTPFQDPVIVDITGSTAKILGSEIFFIPKDKQPVGIYVFDKSNPSQTISLTIVPKEGIPGQNILVKIENFRALGQLAVSADAKKPDAQTAMPADHEGMLSQLVLGGIAGRIPGFNPVPLEGGVAAIEQVQVVPDVVFQGYYLDVYRYELRNKGNHTVALNEGVFYREGIKAISFFPRDTLVPNENTFIFIVASKGMDGSPSSFLSSADQRVAPKLD